MLRFNFAKKNKETIKAYHRLFKTVDGKIVLQDLMQKHRVLKPVFDNDTHVMAMREGERNVILRVMSFLNISETQLEEMMAEHNDRDAQYFEEEDHA